MTTVMVTSAGRRRYVLEELVKFARPGDVVLAADMNPLAPSLSTPGVQAIVVQGGNLKERAQDVRRIVSQEGVDALLSLHDFEAIELSQMASSLAEEGCLFVGPTAETCRVSLDKMALARHLEQIDPNLTPRTYESIEKLESIATSAQRWVIKDRWGSASSGLSFIASEDLLLAATALAPGTWVAQPLADGIEYNVDLFCDVDGTVAGTSTKQKWAMRAGETDSATVLLDPPAEVVHAAIRATESLEVAGNIDVDVILDPSGHSVVIDVNPRFGGGYAFSAVAGYRAGEAIWQLARRERVSPLAPEREVTAAKHVAVAEVTR
ncbi:MULTISPECIES: ATP-grasp domain-containing protein [Dietzia]|uniref:ATP-grasp domain-containing protein n=1 Tax=Dietzia TaxID=37914 RepID=UPI0015FCF4AE|nr:MULTISPECIES: ATP-grasp domain-containing protein [Dietzia]MBB1036637.1 ATP-grasp domain-containing protein [Dietzia natronolimnaea]